ncbi:MAG: hypothetical protein Q9228_005875 [Teloschistes exilis]
MTKPDTRQKSLEKLTFLKDHAHVSVDQAKHATRQGQDQEEGAQISTVKTDPYLGRLFYLPSSPSGSVDASLTEVDASTRDGDQLRKGAVTVGPFSVFSLADQPNPEVPESSVGTKDSDAPADFPTTSGSDLDSILDMSSILGWNDLFDTGLGFANSTIDGQFCEDPSFLLPGVANEPGEFPGQSVSSADLQRQADGQQPQTLAEMTDAEVLSYGQILLKKFKDVIIPTYSPLPMESKSPWEIMNCNAAVQTLADLTYLESSDVKYANKANLYGTLACSALVFDKDHPIAPEISFSKCQQIVEHTGSRAKQYLQQSLRTETTGHQKAKYKDQLMAINTLIALATLLDNQYDARCYLIDAERLLRLRGLEQKELSRRTRLHHVYTWLRIVGESTFTIHDYTSPSLLPQIEESLKSLDGIDHGAAEKINTPAIAYGQLDDFLRVDAQERESEPDCEEYKDRDVGIRDIHLADMRQWSETMYLQIYGIPETWLSMVSQTTRLANVIDVVNASDKGISRSLNASLQRKSSRLESMVCSAASKTPSSCGPRIIHDISSDSSVSRIVSASEAMLRAMNSALVIFFYRRIRNVHHWILQNHVNEVITNLQEFDAGIAQNPSYRSGTVGTVWPAFMAGCEAMTEASRVWLKDWLEKSLRQLPTAGSQASIRIMCHVWRRRDAAMAAEHADESGYKSKARSHKQADSRCSWVDVLREENQWPMLY